MSKSLDEALRRINTGIFIKYCPDLVNNLHIMDKSQTFFMVSNKKLAIDLYLLLTL